MRSEFSSTVRMSLRAGDRTFDVSEMGPDFVRLRHPEDVASGVATVTLSVDESVRSWDVHLPNGISKDEDIVSAEKSQYE